MAETCAHSLHATNPEGSTLETLGAGSGALVVGVEDRLCCCWRCRQLVITDAGSNPELAAWASHFWSSGSVIVMVMVFGCALLFAHCAPGA